MVEKEMSVDWKEKYKNRQKLTKEQLEKAIEEALLEYPAIDENLIYHYIDKLAICMSLIEMYKLFSEGNHLGALKMLGDINHLKETKSLLYNKYGLFSF